MARNKIVALETEDVSIATATVSIKVLQVNNRQMTQAVFRQLPEADLIDEDAIELRGVPWGWVNYSSSDMGPGRQYVAQFGTRLFRCPTLGRLSDSWRRDYYCDSMPNPYCEYLSEYLSHVRSLVCLRVLNGIPQEVRWNRIEKRWEARIDLLRPFSREAIAIDQNLHNVIRDACQRRPIQLYSLEIDLLRRVVTNSGTDPNSRPALLEGRIIDLAAEASDYCRRWDALIEKLSTVEQLYISA